MFGNGIKHIWCCEPLIHLYSSKQRKTSGDLWLVKKQRHDISLPYRNLLSAPLKARWALLFPCDDKATLRSQFGLDKLVMMHESKRSLTEITTEYPALIFPGNRPSQEAMAILIVAILNPAGFDYMESYRLFEPQRRIRHFTDMFVCGSKRLPSPKYQLSNVFFFTFAISQPFIFSGSSHSSLF